MQVSHYIQNEINRFYEMLQKLPPAEEEASLYPYEEYRNGKDLSRITFRVKEVLEEASSRSRGDSLGAIKYMICAVNAYRSKAKSLVFSRLDEKMLNLCKKCFLDISQVYEKKMVMMALTYFGASEAYLIMQEDLVYKLKAECKKIETEISQREPLLLQVAREASSNSSRS